MKTRNLLNIIAAGAIIIGAAGCKSKKNQDLNSREPNCARTSVEPNLGITMGMGEFKTYYKEPNYIDPNLLKGYRVSYDAPKLIGKITRNQIGFFENNKFFAIEEGIAARTIEKLEEVFNPVFRDCQWLINIKKPENMRNVDFTKHKQYTKGFKIQQQLIAKSFFGTKVRATSDIYIFPIEDMNDIYTALSHKIIFVWNDNNIDGLYKKPGIDVNDPNSKPLDYLRLIQRVEENNRLRLSTK